MRSLERVNIRTNVRTYVLTYIRTGQTLYPLHNFVVRGDNDNKMLYLCKFDPNPFIPSGDMVQASHFSTLFDLL